jgi:hypothetical protein
VAAAILLRDVSLPFLSFFSQLLLLLPKRVATEQIIMSTINLSINRIVQRLRIKAQSCLVSHFSVENVFLEIKFSKGFGKKIKI